MITRLQCALVKKNPALPACPHLPASPPGPPPRWESKGPHQPQFFLPLGGPEGSIVQVAVPGGPEKNKNRKSKLPHWACEVVMQFSFCPRGPGDHGTLSKNRFRWWTPHVHQENVLRHILYTNPCSSPHPILAPKMEPRTNMAPKMCSSNPGVHGPFWPRTWNHNAN